jgi:GcrA cell cycle regulator
MPLAEFPARWEFALHKHKRWTNEDSERLKELIESGASAVRAAAAFYTTIQSIRAQARKLGKPFPTTREARKKFADSQSNPWRQY